MEQMVALRGQHPAGGQSPIRSRGRADNFPIKDMLLQLQRSPQQERDLQKLINDLHDPSSPDFHHWLTAKEFGESFGLANQDLDTIERWLEQYGFKVNVVYESGLLIDFSGTAGQVREAFHTSIHRLDVKGKKHFANVSDPKIPAALAPAVKGIVSLHDFMPRGQHTPRPEYTYTSGSYSYYLVTPPDLATIYNVNPVFRAGISGKGQTIVVLEDTDLYDPADWAAFRSVFGLSTYTSGSLVQTHPAPPSGPTNCYDPGTNDDIFEAAIDSEYASSAAPNATIQVASCLDTTTFGGLIALQNLLNESSKPPAIVSISYGECEAALGATGNAAYSAAYQQADAEGVSVFVSTGDSGASSCGGPDNPAYGIGVSGFASTPYNVAVGGTDFADTSAGTIGTYWSTTNSATFESALSYIPEIPWNSSCASQLLAEYNGYSQTYGAGGFCNSGNDLNADAGAGGPSGCATGATSQPGVVSGTCAGWSKPAWQTGVGVPNDGVRDVPDVAMFAANGVWEHAYVYCIGSSTNNCNPSNPLVDWYGGGGTSFGAPIMAGIQALVNQNTGERQGNPDTVYYNLAASEYGASGDSSCNSTLGNTISASCIFNDVTLGDNDIVCLGYDNCYQPSGSYYGVLSTSDSSYEPAYSTATGWDFATGLGSVNAANLVNNWSAGVPNFTLSASPNVVTIVQGVGSGTSSITINSLKANVANATLAISGLPKGVTASFSPNPANTSAVLTFAASSTAKKGTVTATITATSGSVSVTTTITITVNPLGSFTLTASPKTLTVAQGSATNSTITITPSDMFDQSVSLSAGGLPSGVTASFNSNPATSVSTLSLLVSNTAATGKATITVTGTSGSLIHTTKVTLVVKQ